nr:hypothetical protein Iba_chr07aCG1690 [Ipomoea batatas]
MLRVFPQQHQQSIPWFRGGFRGRIVFRGEISPHAAVMPPIAKHTTKLDIKPQHEAFPLPSILLDHRDQKAHSLQKTQHPSLLVAGAVDCQHLCQCVIFHLPSYLHKVEDKRRKTANGFEGNARISKSNTMGTGS